MKPKDQKHINKLLGFKGIFYFLVLVTANCLNLGNPSGLGPMGLFSTETKFSTFAGDPSLWKQEGRACQNRFMFFWNYGDASLETAANNAGITQIHSVTREVDSGFLFWNAKNCLVVRGY